MFLPLPRLLLPLVAPPCLAINDAEPWFGEHIARNKYIALLQQEEPEANENQLLGALLRRAMEDVRRLLVMREDRPVLASLIKQGTIGDEIWTQFSIAEKEIEAEMVALLHEGETFKEGWGQGILQTASEMVSIVFFLPFPSMGRGSYRLFASYPTTSFFLIRSIRLYFFAPQR